MTNRSFWSKYVNRSTRSTVIKTAKQHNEGERPVRNDHFTLRASSHPISGFIHPKKLNSLKILFSLD